MEGAINTSNLHPEFLSLLAKQYEKPNWKVKGERQSSVLYVFPSSNGLYFPNTPDVFQNEIIKRDKFEWESIGDDAVANARRLFLRDIHKQWYVRGIGPNHSSVDSIIEFVNEQTEGRRLRLIGSSSGGYLSVILGLALQAEMVLSFSGQFQLDATARDHPIENTLLMQNLDSKYRTVSFLFERNTVTPVFYFVGIDSKTDRPDLEVAESHENVFVFRFRSDIHGVPFPAFVLKYLIGLDLSSLYRLHEECNGATLWSFSFALKVCGVRIVMVEYMRMIVRKLIKLVRL